MHIWVFLNLKNIKKTLKTWRGKNRLLQSNMNQTSIRHLISMLEENEILFSRFREEIIFFKYVLLNLETEEGKEIKR